MDEDEFDPDDYVDLLRNPFSTTPVKFLDGKVSLSSAVQTKSDGVIPIPSAGDVLEFYLQPCLNNFVYPNRLGGIPSAMIIPPGHMDNATTVTRAHFHRLISVGLKLRCLNELNINDDGYWEAVRLPVFGPNNDFTVVSGQWKYNDYGYFPVGSDLSNIPTYQTGKLRDLDKFVFKLNRENNSRQFDREILKAGFDYIYIRIFGRKDDLTRISWNAVCNQEIVYLRNTNLSRLMTRNIAIPDIEYYLHQANEADPGVPVQSILPYF